MRTLTFGNLTLLRSAIIGFETSEHTHSDGLLNALRGRLLTGYHICIRTTGSDADVYTTDKGQYDQWVSALRNLLTLIVYSNP